MKNLCVLACLALVASCSGEYPDAPPSDLTRSEARELGGVWKGKKGKSTDICDVLGWYDDGICDPFCKNPDPDCDDGEPHDDDVCGGDSPGGSNTCDSDQYCDYSPNSCGHADETGECKERPESCTAQYSPVCGCDGKTYSNSCRARRAGTDIDYTGECEDSRDDSPNSCEDRCGDHDQVPGDEGCYCDSACENYGDCCGDYEELCD